MTIGEKLGDRGGLCEMSSQAILGFALVAMLLAPAVEWRFAEALPEKTARVGAHAYVGIYEFAAGELVVPDQYSTIQNAIDEANPGDVVFVKEGVYVEHVVVNKTVSLIGENNKTTIIDGNKTGPVVLIAAEGVNITGFTIRAGQNTHPICDVWLENVSRCSVHGNVLESAFYGVYLNEACGNSIFENSATDGSIGVCGFHSHGNSISRNTFVANSFAGMNFHLCSFNNLTENVIRDNSVGLRFLDGANNNTVYHNNFVDNTAQAFVQSSYNNSWDDGYPSGGNYWSNYGGFDVRSGPFQNVTGSDGLGDTRFVVDLNNIDRYPLKKSWPCLFGDVNGDCKVDMRDVGFVARRFMSWPGDPLWHAAADVIVDGWIDMKDIGNVAKRFGEHCL